MASLINAVVFVDRNGFLFYAQGLPSTLQFNFVPSVVSDLEIIDQDAFASQVASFLSQAKIPPFQAAILLADGFLFEKQFTSAATTENKEVAVFLDNLPFENVGKVFYNAETFMCIATNKDIYKSLASCFEKHQGTVMSVIPAFAVEIDASKMVSLNDQILADIFRRSAANQVYDFLKDSPLPKIQNPAETPRVQNQKGSPEQKTQPETDKKRLFVLLGVFGILVIALVVVALTML